MSLISGSVVSPDVQIAFFEPGGFNARSRWFRPLGRHHRNVCKKNSLHPEGMPANARNRAGIPDDFPLFVAQARLLTLPLQLSHPFDRLGSIVKPALQAAKNARSVARAQQRQQQLAGLIAGQMMRAERAGRRCRAFAGASSPAVLQCRNARQNRFRARRRRAARLRRRASRIR